MRGEALRELLRHYPTGVTVVTVHGSDGPYGLTVNAFMSLSMDPPSVVVSLQREGRTARALRETGFYAVNILGSGQESLVWTFADPQRSMPERFASTRWERDRSWIVLPDSVGTILVRVTHRWDVHDHELFAGVVEDVRFWNPDRPPLLYLYRKVLRGPNRGD